MQRFVSNLALMRARDNTLEAMIPMPSAMRFRMTMIAHPADVSRM